MNRLLSAYPAIWDRHPTAVYVTLLAVIIASITGGAVAVLASSPLALIPLATLLAALALLCYAPDGPE